jgi:multidrug transporter EmrE-like cation transporter
MTVNPPQWHMVLLVVAYMSVNCIANLCFRLVVEPASALPIGYFIAGNGLGFVSTILLTLALKGQNPNIIYAICLGGGFCLLQVTSWFLFKSPLSPVQWAGITLVACGIFCLRY